MGFLLLGLLTLHRVGMEGAVLQMFSHGVIAGLLFAVVGRMVYDRTHTRELDLLERWDLARALPFAAVTFVLAAMASMGLPGFSGFVAEISVLIGAWHAFPLAVLTAGVGIVLGVAYSLRALQKAFLAGPDVAPGAPARPLEPISLPEKAGACLLLAATVVVGLFPQLLLRLIAPSWESVLFQQFRREAGW
jgi:NADH-quinone oxidoreductase subunit M